MTFKSPATQALVIDGPAGSLEALLEVPEAHDGKVAVLCHPHPLYQGTMNNKVVHTLARAFQRLGAATLRFNFRGVGKSAGVYANGDGETDDAMAATEYMRQRWPQSPLWIGGFSFGGIVAMRTAARANADFLVTVAPAVHRFGPEQLELPACPWLLVHGNADEIVDCDETLVWARGVAPGPEIAVIPDATHFFHGKLTELRDVVTVGAAKLSVQSG